MQQGDYQFKLGQYISSGFDVFKIEAGSFIGFLIVSMLISLVLAFIPFLGTVINLIISGSLGAGYSIVASRIVEKEDVTFSNFFDGFDKLGPFVIFNILIFCIFAALAILAGGSAFLTLFTSSGGNIDFSELTSPSFLVTMGIIGFISFIIFILLMYVPQYIVFDNMDAFSSMKASATLVAKKPFHHMLFLIVWGLIIIVSCIPLLLGLLVTIPAMQVSIHMAWRDMTNYDNRNNESVNVADHLV